MLLTLLCTCVMFAQVVPPHPSRPCNTTDKSALLNFQLIICNFQHVPGCHTSSIWAQLFCETRHKSTCTTNTAPFRPRVVSRSGRLVEVKLFQGLLQSCGLSSGSACWNPIGVPWWNPWWPNIRQKSERASHFQWPVETISNVSNRGTNHQSIGPGAKGCFNNGTLLAMERPVPGGIFPWMGQIGTVRSQWNVWIGAGWKIFSFIQITARQHNGCKRACSPCSYNIPTDLSGSTFAAIHLYIHPIKLQSLGYSEKTSSFIDDFPIKTSFADIYGEFSITFHQHIIQL